MGREGGSSGARWAPVAALAARLAPGRTRLDVVPASSVPGAELVHLGGGETLPCPDAPALPIDPGVRRAGLGGPSLALPPARVHALGHVVVHPSRGCVVTPVGVVAESLPPDRATRHRRMVVADATPVELPGVVAVYRTADRSTYHTLVEHLPRAALLAHPAMRRFGTVTLLHDGPLDPLEAWLLPRLVGRNVGVRCVEPDVAVAAPCVLVPSPVHRPGAGAVPSWYRRWADRATDVPVAEGGRRLFLATAEELDGVANRDRLLEVLAATGAAVVDPTATDPEELVARCRDAEVLAGLSRSALAHAVFSRRARVVEVLRRPSLHPAVYYLAVSKGLPHHVVPPPGVDGRDDVVDVDGVRRALAS